MARTNARNRSFRALLGAFLNIDLRAQHYADATGAKPGDLIPPLYWVFGQFLAISALLTALLFGRVSAWFFAAAHLVVTVLLVLSALVVEIDEAIFDPKDQEVLAHRPLSARTYAAARLTNLLIYVALMTVALGVSPSIVGAALRDSNWIFGPVYWFVQIAVAVIVAALVVLVRTLSNARLDVLRPAMAWVQILAIVALFYGGQLVLRNGDGQLELFAASAPSWFVQAPTSLLARALVGVVQEGPRLEHLVPLGIAGGAAALLFVVAIVRLSATYRVLGMHHAAQTSSVGTTFDTPLAYVANVFTSGRIEAASFMLTTRMFLRDPDLRLRLLPALALSVAALGLGIATKQSADPFVLQHSTVVLPLTVPALTAGAMPQMLYALRFTRHADAAWILRVSPASLGSVRRGVEAAVLVWVVVPYVVLLFAAFVYAWKSPGHAVLLAGFTAILSAATLRWTSRSALDVPFSMPSARGAMSGVIVLLASVVTAIASLATGVLYAVAGDERREMLVLCVLCVVLVGARAFTQRGDR